MDKMTMSETRDYFLKNGEKFFYLADTCWSAFTNPTFEEWGYYLEYRRMQGFNAIQIDVLPQYDRSETDYYLNPFKLLPDARWDFNKKNEEYFDRAEKMVEMAIERGFTPALVVLWCNYVKGTWLSAKDPSKIIPKENLEEYVEYVAERFGKYDVIFIISGDTDLASEDAVEYYTTALRITKKTSPNSLTTMHLMGGLGELPESILESPYYDFYMYQSSHQKEHQYLTYELAQRFYKMPVKRPVVNGEPCYEGIGSIGTYSKHGRFNNFDVRKAIWQSLLSGAKAGVTYGAHGIWSWQKGEKEYKYTEVYVAPYDWRVALHFPGAFDASFAKWVFEKYDLFNIEPANEKLLNETSEIRASEGEDKIVIYTPFNTDIKLKVDGSSYKWEGIELQNRKIFKPKIKNEKEYSTVKMTEFNGDLLIVGIKP